MCKACGYVHPHVHTKYSLLDGMSNIEELVIKAKEFNMESVAISDHGSMSGLWEAQKAGDKHGVKIMHACEFYYERENDGKNGHLLVIAKNNKGLENMFLMNQIAYVSNFYRKPRINWEILKEHSEGLIITSSCLASTYCQLIMEGDVSGARDWLRKFKLQFGEDFYIEVQPNQIPEQHQVNRVSERLGKELGIKLIASNDVHYTLDSDCFPHEVLLAMQVKKKMSDEKRFKFDTQDFWFKTKEEMWNTFIETNSLSEEAIKEAMETTLEVSSKVESRIEKGRYLPHYHDVPKGMTEGDLLWDEAYDGSRKRGLDKDKEYMQGIKHELEVIEEEGYSGYFLVVQDMVMSAKRRGDLVGDGRGSGAGSKVAYSTGITEIPPHEYDLLFERFMAKGREPDFDVDYEDQDAVFEDLVKKYGKDSVARIIAFGTFSPRNVIRKVLNTFEHEEHIIKQITSMIPNLCPSISEAIKQVPELLKRLEEFPTEWGVIQRLEGCVSHESQHAGGIIIYPNIAKYAPVKTNRDAPDKLIVAWDKYMLEELGHFKFDVLGLETLPILNDAVKTIKEELGVEVNLLELPKDDEKVYDMLCKGDVSGVFQISNQAEKVMQQQPRDFKDLIAINALVRPGVGDWDEYIERRKGKDYEIYEPRRPYMEETVGTMTYQEQFLLDAHILAGWGIAYADKKLRKNKDIRNDVETKNKFIEDCKRNGHGEIQAQEVWSEIEDAVDGGYSFNKSHSASYAQTSYQTAWLKAHYPEHFYASLMSKEGTDADGQSAIAGYLAEAKRRGITILPPSINQSTERFRPTKEGIAYRITTIKHVGDTAIKAIEDLRPIGSFDDFLARRNKSTMKKNVVVNLIKAGAFDEFGKSRATLLWEFDMHNRTKTQVKNDIILPAYPEDDKVKMAWEKEVLGMYLSLHPLERYSFKPFEAYKDGQTDALVGGEVIARRVFKDKNNNEMAFITVDTLHGNVKIICFSSSWGSTFNLAFRMGNIVMVKGKKSGNDLIANTVEVLEYGTNIESSEE